ncbi:hypothetical protein, partial [Marinimicrobium agarilyticum]|uniref:hypothetical protein n=1 Tax=Marinimicrobium agarilyticum TaxID=306546 RepID=UPI000409465A
MTSLLLLTSLMLLSLFAVHMVNKREEKSRRIRLQQRRLRWRIDALEEVLVGVEETLPTRTIARFINAEILHLLEQALELEKGQNSHLETRINHVQQRDEEMAQKLQQPSANRLRESDAEMARTKEALEQAAQVLRRQSQQGRLARESLDDHLRELSWTKLMVEVVTYIAEGHKAVMHGDFTTSQAYYKKAQSLLISSDDPNPKRMEVIRELGEVIQGKRQALSQELMPEDDYNPHP